MLAIDQSLNPLVKNLDAVTTAKTGGINILKKLLPKGWVGSQVFIVNSTYNGKPVDLILVPFADAGQTGGEVRVWIEKK